MDPERLIASRDDLADLAKCIRERARVAMDCAHDWQVNDRPTDAERCRGKASAYAHAAELVEARLAMLEGE